MSQLSPAYRARHRSLTVFAAVIALLASLFSGVAVADGTETLGPPSVPLAEGSGFAIGGTGLNDGQPAAFDVDVPAGATVEQVLLYWEGFDKTVAKGGDETITVNGTPVTGVLIGGPTLFFANAASSTFRADITDLGLVSNGTSTLTIEDVDFETINNGAGALVVYDDGSEVDLQLVDGNDLAFFGFKSPLDTTVPQTFDFEPVPFERTVDLSMFATSVDGASGEPRPNAVLVTIDGDTIVFDTPFASNTGNEWDAVTLTVTVPAEASSMTIQAISADVDGSGGNPASFGWIGVAASIPLPAELGDRVWLDGNSNGLQDDGEIGVADVLVTLTDCDGNLVASQPTDGDGNYLFDGLEPNCYQVAFDLPDGFEFTLQDAGDDDTTDSDADLLTGATTPVTLVSGERNPTIDAGVVPLEPGIDLEKLTNGNQADQANDADVPQIAPGESVTWSYIVTNTGDVSFAAADVEVIDDVIGPITTIVDQGDGDDVLAPGEVWTYEATGTADDLAAPSADTVVVAGCNPDGAPVPGDRATYENIGSVTVPGDTDADPSHYCNPPVGSIGDFVWLDENGNGLQDPDEPGVQGATVTLTDCDGNVLDSQTTSADGAYLFTELEADCYRVTFELSDGLGLTTPDIGGDDTIDSDADTLSGTSPEIDLGIGEDNDTIDAGAVVLLGSIGDFVWRDENGNGLQDADEPGVEGATVTLTDCLDSPFVSQTTGADGGYLFTDLEADCYKVLFELPDGLIFTIPNRNGDDVDSDANLITGRTPQIFLAPGGVDPTIDAGALPLGSIGDFVWLDENGNGLQDPDEPGVEGATVTLTDCSDPATLLAAATTDDSGFYEFTGLEADCYRVTFELPDGLGLTTPDIGGDDTIDSDADTLSGTSPEIDLGIGEDNDTIDAGAVVLVGSIGDFVWDDLNKDGVQDPDEPGIEDAVATLSDCDGNVLDTQTTGADGAYLFTGLEADCYQVTFELPSSYVFTTPDVGDDDTFDSDADPATGVSPTTDLAAGEDNLTIDAGGVLLQPEIMLEKYTLVVPSQAGGDLCETFGKPAQLTMIYTGDGPDATSSSQDPSKVVVTGDPSDAITVYIVASKDPLGGGEVFFAGTVGLDEEFVIDAALGGRDELHSATQVTIYASQGGAVLQEIEFHTSCSQPLFLGDQFGATQLVGFTDGDGQGSVLPPPSSDLGEDADTPTGPEASTGDTIQWTYVATNPGDVPLADVVVTDDAGTPDDPTDDFAAAALVEGGVNVGDANQDGLLDPAEEWRFRATGTAQLGQYANLGTVVAQPVLEGAPFGDPVSDTDPSHYIGIFGADVCEVFDKSAQLTMRYTGDGPDATSNSQDSSKVVVTGDPADANPVFVVASKDPLGGDEVYFAGTVGLDEEFVIDATLAGRDNLASATFVTIYSSEGGAVLQEIEFHTSCSQPLFLGDQFGSIQLVDFVDKNGDGPGTTPLTGIVLDSLEFKGKELKIKLENLDGVDVVLAEVELSWPTAVNGGLTEIKNGGDSIYKPGSPVLASPATVEEGDWTADVNKRSLKAGDTREFKFKFENDVSTELPSYAVTFTFSDGTTVVVDG